MPLQDGVAQCAAHCVVRPSRCYCLEGVAPQDLVHDISDVVKKVDKGTKTVLIKTADGTEHTIKYTDKTTLAATMAL